jgi:hypothetical protein
LDHLTNAVSLLSLLVEHILNSLLNIGCRSLHRLVSLDHLEEDAALSFITKLSQPFLH